MMPLKFKKMLDAIFDERRVKEKEIIKKAKAEGRWAPGLDSNKELFEELEKETRAKFEKVMKELEEYNGER